MLLTQNEPIHKLLKIDALTRLVEEPKFFPCHLVTDQVRLGQTGYVLHRRGHPFELLLRHLRRRVGRRPVVFRPQVANLALLVVGR